MNAVVGDHDVGAVPDDLSNVRRTPGEHGPRRSYTAPMGFEDVAVLIAGVAAGASPAPS